MALSVLKQFKRTAFITAVLATSAAFTACGGGGGGSDGGGLEAKVAITNPSNGSNLIDASGNIQLKWLAAADKSSLFVVLNGVDITAYFQDKTTAPKASIFALQGLLKEGSNRLTVKAKDSTTEAITFNADLSTPELIITDVIAGAGDSIASGVIRKSTLNSVDYTFANGNSGSTLTIDGASFTPHSFLTNAAVPTGDTQADLNFTVVDNSTVLAGGAGNEGKMSLAFPGRTIQAALATQINNDAFNVLETWVNEIATGYINDLAGDTAPLLNIDESAEQGVCAQVGNGAEGQNIVTGAQNQYCQVFVSNVVLGNLTTDLAVINDADSDDGFNVKASVTVSASTGSAVVKVYDKAAYDADETLTELATITAPLTINNTVVDMVFGVKKGTSGSLDLHLEAIETPVRSSNVVTIATVIAPSAQGTCGPSCNKSTIPQSAVQTVINEIFEPAVIALSLDEQLRMALFCDIAGDNAGDDAVCDETEIPTAVNTTDYPIIAAKVDVEEAIEHEGQQVATLTSNASASVVSKVGLDLSTAKGAFVQMAASAFTEEFGGNVDFKDALGAYFEPLKAATSPIALQNLGTAQADDILMALPANMLNQALLSVFQSGVVNKQQVSMKIGDIDPSLATAAINISTPATFNTKAVGLYDDMVFNFDLKSPPYLKFVQVGAEEFIELHVNALQVTANIVVPSNPFYSPIEKAECTGIANPYPDCVNVSAGFGDGVGAAEGGALDMEIDLVARLQVSLDGESLPLLAIDSSYISVSFANFDNYVTRKLVEAESKGLCSNLAQIVSGFNCADVSFERGDVVAQIPSLLDPILSQLNTGLIDGDTRVLRVPAFDFLTEDKRQEVILTDFGIDAANSAFVLKADVCDASVSKTNLAGGCAKVHGVAKGIQTLIITKTPAEVTL